MGCDKKKSIQIGETNFDNLKDNIRVKKRISNSCQKYFKVLLYSTIAVLHARMCFLVYKIVINGSYHGCQNLNYKSPF